MYRRYGNWQDAIAAYNWGPGNLDAWIGGGRAADKLPLAVERYRNRVLREAVLAEPRISPAGRWELAAPPPPGPAGRPPVPASVASASGFSIGGQPGVDDSDRLIHDRVAHAVLRPNQLHEPVRPLDVGGTVVEGPGRRGGPHQVVCGGGIFLERHQVVRRCAEPL